MNFGSIKLCDCANGPGLRTSLFVSGCTHHCKGCFNEETWDFSYGEPYTSETEAYILRTLMHEGAEGLSILGGEPMEPENMQALYTLIYRAKGIEKDIWIYTGYTWEQLLARNEGRDIWALDADMTIDILRMIDVLVDGPFIEAEKDISLRFRGSRNQRIIDVQESLRAGRVVLWEGE